MDLAFNPDQPRDEKGKWTATGAADGKDQSNDDNHTPVCFAAGTLVLMADGSIRAIETIEPGQRVMAAPEHDPEAIPLACRVAEVYHHPPRPLVAVTMALLADPIEGASIYATAAHPFYVKERGWSPAIDLKPGDKLRTATGLWVKVREVADTGRTESVFNLRVEGWQQRRPAPRGPGDCGEPGRQIAVTALGGGRGERLGPRPGPARRVGVLRQTPIPWLASASDQLPTILMSHLLHLSAAGAFEPVVVTLAGYPADIAGQPCVYLRKDLIHCGHYTHPAKGFEVPVDAKRLDGWVANFRKMAANGVKVPINLDHSDRAADCIGYVVEMKRQGDALQAVCQFIGEDAARLAARNYVSVGIDPDYTDGQERSYGDTIVHVALTPVPIVPDQENFVRAEGGDGESDGVLTLAVAKVAQGSSDMADTMLPVSDETAAQLYNLVPGLEEAPVEEKVACLCRHLREIARRDREDKLALSRVELHNFNAE